MEINFVRNDSKPIALMKKALFKNLFSIYLSADEEKQENGV